MIKIQMQFPGGNCRNCYKWVDEPDYIKRKRLAEQFLSACIDLEHEGNADKEHAEHGLR
jgi:hypothetical protein